MQHDWVSAVRLRAVLFDYGGTLDGEASHWLDRFVGLYAEAGVTVPFAQLKEAFYAADNACYESPAIRDAGLKELMEFHVGVQLRRLALPDPKLQDHLIDRFVTDSLRSLEASRRVLASLASTFRLGVVSNFYGNVERVLADAGFAPLLTVVADSHRLGVSKPDPHIYAWAVTQLGIAPSEVLHVGDSYERDVAAARAAGLRTAWLVGTATPTPPDRPPDLTLRSLDEMLAYLDLF